MRLKSTHSASKNMDQDDPPVLNGLKWNREKQPHKVASCKKKIVNLSDGSTDLSNKYAEDT